MQFVKKHTRKYFISGQPTARLETTNGENVNNATAALADLNSDQKALSSIQIGVEKDKVCIICLQGSADGASLYQLISPERKSKLKSKSKSTSCPANGTVLDIHTAHEVGTGPEEKPVFKKKKLFKKKPSFTEDMIFDDIKHVKCGARSPHLFHRECIRLWWFHTPTKWNKGQAYVRANTCPVCFREIFEMKDGAWRKPKSGKVVKCMFKSPFYAVIVILALGCVTFCVPIWLLLRTSEKTKWVYMEGLEKVGTTNPSTSPWL
jgi:hypothetical protein